MKKKGFLTLVIALALVSFLTMGTRAEAASASAIAYGTVDWGSALKTNVAFGAATWYTFAAAGAEGNGLNVIDPLVGTNTGSNSYAAYGTVASGNAQVAGNVMTSTSQATDGWAGNWLVLDPNPAIRTPNAGWLKQGTWTELFTTGTVAANGSVLISIPYQASVTVQAPDYAAGEVWIQAYLSKPGGGFSQASIKTGDYVPYQVGSTWVWSSATENPLGSEIQVSGSGYKAGDTVSLDLYMYTWAAAKSPVPIPGAVWLLGSGLVGLVGIRRRFRK